MAHSHTLSAIGSMYLKIMIKNGRNKKYVGVWKDPNWKLDMWWIWNIKNSDAEGWEETMRVMSDEGERNILMISVYSLNEQYKRQLNSIFEWTSSCTGLLANKSRKEYL